MSDDASSPSPTPDDASAGEPVRDPVARLIFEQSLVAGMFFDPDALRVSACNRAAVSFWGETDPNALVGKTLDELCAAQAQPGGAALVRRSFDLARSIGASVFAWSGLRPDGSRWEAEAHLKRISHEGREALWLQLIDTSAHRAASEALDRASRAQTAMLRGLSHRVKNNLQIIASLFTMQSDAVTDPRARSALTDASLRVRAVELVHRFLEDGGGTTSLDFSEYAQSLCLLARAERDPSAQVSFVSDPVPLSLELAVPCGLIVHELVLESLEQGRSADGSCAIHVEIHEADGELSIAVSDRGSTEAGRVFDSGSVRMQLLVALMRQLRARLMRTSQEGARVTVRVPIGDPERDPAPPGP
jgi:two-component sensor histidine kinase